LSKQYQFSEEGGTSIVNHLHQQPRVTWSMLTTKVNVKVITVFTVFRLLTDFVCLYTYEFWLFLWKIVRSSVILLLSLWLFTSCMTDLYYQVLMNHLHQQPRVTWSMLTTKVNVKNTFTSHIDKKYFWHFCWLPYLYRASSNYSDFLKRHLYLRNRLLDQGYKKIRLIRSLKKFIFRYQYLVEIYSFSRKCILYWWWVY
jgi:hypothetical protein